MKQFYPLCAVACLGLLAACGSDEKTTIVHEKPVIVNTAPSGAAVESTCKHGYDNATHSCY